jgi:hypothetical protein
MAQANAVALKLPSFWTADPEMWFVHVEGLFATRATPITLDATKYGYLVSALDQQVIHRLRRKILDAPEADKYDHLKAALLKAYGLTEEQKAFRLAGITTLATGMKPTALLDEMEGLAESVTSKAFELHFRRAMPPEVTKCLAGQSFHSISDFATAADRVIEDLALLQPTDGATMAAVDTASRRSTRPSRPVTDNAQTGPYCFYHNKFRQQARKCRAPCQWAHDHPGNADADRQ